MAVIRSPAIILHRIPYSESSLILKAFTRESGLISLIAKGANKPKSKFQGLLDFFSIYELIYRTKTRETLLTLSEASLISDFPGIKDDLNKQSLANVMLETFLRHLLFKAGVPTISDFCNSAILLSLRKTLLQSLFNRFFTVYYNGMLGTGTT